MVKQRKPSPQAAHPRPGVTPERFVRLYRLVVFLGGGPKTRDRVLKHLKQDVRGFYRDLKALKDSEVEVTQSEGLYTLVGAVADALERLHFPDPRLTLGEAQQLARGRSRAHTYLKGQVENLVSRAAPPRR
jgi:hypothetical protein